MTIGIATAVRNAMLNAIRDAIDASGAAKVRLYSGSRPATGGAETTILAELTMSNPSAPNAASGVLTLNAITQDSAADASGTATWFRVLTNANVAIIDGSCSATGGGGDLEMVTAAVIIGQPIQISSFTITQGNP